MSLKNLKKEEKLLRRFLRERQLTTAFNRFKKFKSVKKRSLVVTQELDDRTVRRTKIFILKRRGKTEVRRARDFEVLATTKKSIPKAMSNITKRVKRTRKLSIGFTKKVKTPEGFIERKVKRNWDVKIDTTTNKLPLKVEREVSNYNEKSGFLNTVTTRNFALKKSGSVVVDATVVCSNSGRKIRVNARSRIFEDLYDKEIRDIALQDAIDNASAVAECTPRAVIVHNYWFEYRRSKYIPKARLTLHQKHA